VWRAASGQAAEQPSTARGERARRGTAWGLKVGQAPGTDGARAGTLRRVLVEADQGVPVPAWVLPVQHREGVPREEACCAQRAGPEEACCA
jgi:hypothetical protein